MVGITRIEIIRNSNGLGAYRFDKSRQRWPMADELYRTIAHRKGLNLLPGYEIIQLTEDEAKANYDIELGIDLILTFDNGLQMTMQEKILYTTFKTVTVEYMNDPTTGDRGDWFNLHANWYFVGYDPDESFKFSDWILLDWPAVKLLTGQNKIQWYDNGNKRDGARATFKFAPMSSFPDECIVAYSKWSEFCTGQMALFRS